MTNKEMRFANIKYQLSKKKDDRKKYVIWKLDDNMLEYIQRLGYQVEPWIYEIKTRKSASIRNAKSSIVKELHYANSRGKRSIYCKLKVGEKHTLDEIGITYRPYKYKIHLQYGKAT